MFQIQDHSLNLCMFEQLFKFNFRFQFPILNSSSQGASKLQSMYFFSSCILLVDIHFCHTWAQLIIPDLLILIPDDQLGPSSGISARNRLTSRPSCRLDYHWNSLGLDYINKKQQKMQIRLGNLKFCKILTLFDKIPILTLYLFHTKRVWPCSAIACLH